MSKNKKTKKRGPYKCSICDSLEHRANACTSSKARLGYIEPLDGPTALRTLIIEDFAIFIVVSGQAQDALIGALNGYEPRNGLGMSMVNAYSELIQRTRAISPSVIDEARSTKEALDRAQLAYNQAIEPIRRALRTDPTKANQ